MRGKAPWKLKGKIQEKKFIFDLEEDTIIYKGYKEYDEIPVSNRFDLLDDRDTQYNYVFDYDFDCFVNNKFDIFENSPINDLISVSSSNNNNNSNNSICNSSNDVDSTTSNDIANIIHYNPAKDSLYSDSTVFSNKCYNYAYERNKNFCSGYFPSFITLTNSKLDLISKNNNINNISDNYYLKTKNGKYLKQVTNNKSKYNLDYINHLRSNCQEIINKNISSKTLISKNNNVDISNNRGGGNDNNKNGLSNNFNNNRGGGNDILSITNNIANNNMKLDSHTGIKYNYSHQKGTTTSHTGVVPQLQYVNNPHTGVASQRGRKKYTNNYNQQKGATISHTGVAPQPQYMNNSHTGVISYRETNSYSHHRGATISHTGVAPRIQQVNDSHTGATAHIETNREAHQLQPQYVDNSHTGVTPQSRTEVYTHTGAETHTRNIATDKTPCTNTIDRPRRKLFEDIVLNKIDIDIVPEEVNLEVLLINSLIINVIKVQTVVENFVRDKDYNSIFCMTETKVDSHNFEPRGIKIFSKHRFKRDKKGGGLAIGFKKDHRIRLEEIKVKNQDILALEGTIMNTKIRIVLSYFDSTKLKAGKDFDRNRKIQKEIEKLIEVDPGTTLICLGDFNGRLTKLEPNIITDANGKMLEDWVNNYDLHHLNTTEKCTGKYTFHSKNGRSAIDHVLINNTLLDNYVGMYIDEDRTMLSISDHSLVRVWFRLGTDKEKPNWKGKKI